MLTAPAIPTTQKPSVDFFLSSFHVKQVAFLKVLLLNQKRFSFHRVFKFLLTSLFLDASVLLRTPFAMANGDLQGRSEVSKSALDHRCQTLLTVVAVGGMS
jgi:hypothetical protein